MLDAGLECVHLGTTDLPAIPLSTFPPPSTDEPTNASLEAFDELLAAVAGLQEATERELREQREWLVYELARVEAELTELAGQAEPVEPAEPAPAETPKAAKKVRSKATAEVVRKISLEELVAELEAAPDRTLNIRKAHLDVKSIKALAKANAHVLQLGGKGAWPTVTLVKISGEPAPEARTAESPQGVFSFGESPDGSRRRKKDHEE